MYRQSIVSYSHLIWKADGKRYNFKTVCVVIRMSMDWTKMLLVMNQEITVKGKMADGMVN